MRVWQRDTLILGLAVTAGSLDSWSYFGLAHVFIANNTGNTLIIGFSAATAHWARALSAGGALVSYAAGVFAGSLLSRPVRQAARRAPPQAVLWPRRTTSVLALQLALLLLAGSLATVFTPAQGSLLAHGLVALGAVAVGLQSAVIQAMKLPGVITTYISGTWTVLMGGLAQLTDGEESGEPTAAWEQRLALQCGVLVVYCGSAAASGLLFRAGGHTAMAWLPAAALAAVVLGAAFWLR